MTSGVAVGADDGDGPFFMVDFSLDSQVRNWVVAKGEEKP